MRTQDIKILHNNKIISDFRHLYLGSLIVSLISCVSIQDTKISKEDALQVRCWLTEKGLLDSATFDTEEDASKNMMVWLERKNLENPGVKYDKQCHRLPEK